MYRCIFYFHKDVFSFFQNIFNVTKNITLTIQYIYVCECVCVYVYMYHIYEKYLLIILTHPLTMFISNTTDICLFI